MPTHLPSDAYCVVIPRHKATTRDSQHSDNCIFTFSLVCEDTNCLGLSSAAGAMSLCQFLYVPHDTNKQQATYSSCWLLGCLCQSVCLLTRTTTWFVDPFFTFVSIKWTAVCSQISTVRWHSTATPDQSSSGLFVVTYKVKPAGFTVRYSELGIEPIACLAVSSNRSRTNCGLYTSFHGEFTVSKWAS